MEPTPHCGFSTTLFQRHFVVFYEFTLRSSISFPLNMRKKIVAGNWKMNKTLAEAMELVLAIQHSKEEYNNNVKVIIAPPALYLANLEVIHDPCFELAAQNCSHHAYGAVTGEISAPMLAAMNIHYCIVGHSERRQYFHETNDLLAKKVDMCLMNQIHPIYCCGETLEERKSNNHFSTVAAQLSEALYHLSADDMRKVVVAYEPVWAIGTGVTASSEQAEEMHAFIRTEISAKYGAEVADSISILYGGSVNAANSAELFACPNVDGGLVGGASLKAADFKQIIISAGA
jgi:triosephosphate isomerase